MARDELIWKRLNGERLRKGRPMVSLAKVQRAARLMLGAERLPCLWDWGTRPKSGPVQERPKPEPKPPAVIATGEQRHSSVLRSHVRKVRICIGHDLPDGTERECATDISHTPNTQLRCEPCRQEQHNYRRMFLRKQRSENPAGTCRGHDTKDGHIDCPKTEGLESQSSLRCRSCNKHQKRWNSLQAYHRSSSHVRKDRKRKHERTCEPAQGPRKAVHHCSECFGITDRRPLVGLCKCGLPYQEEKLERGTVLRSNAAGTFTRHYGR